jgi:hypothetical protein
MTYRPIATITYTALTLCAVGGCDKPVEVEETPAPAPAQADATLAADARLDLEAVVARVSSGEVSSAAELEAELDVDAVAHVDLDADGKRDELRIVERRAEKTTVFEIRAVPSSKVDVDVEVAPVVAQIELEAKADAGTAVARASWSASFAAKAKLDAHATVEHTFTGVVVGGEGRMHVEADANVFVAWAFRPARPVYVAEVFVIHEVEPPPSDPCWPPGHCKHGFWKATGDHKKGRDDATFATGHKELGDRSVVVVHHGSKSHDDHAKPSAKKAHHDADHGAKGGKGKGDKGKGGKGKGK